MLTCTYALVALTIEHKKIRGRLIDLRLEVQNGKNRKLNIDLQYFDSLIARFTQFDTVCGGRNIELFVIPAIRSATTEAESILSNIAVLSSKGKACLKLVHTRLVDAHQLDSFKTDELFDLLEQYCQHLMERLVAEELHVLPLAQRVIKGEEWFDIAAQFISHASESQPKKMVQAEFIGATVSNRRSVFNRKSDSYQAN